MSAPIAGTSAVESVSGAGPYVLSVVLDGRTLWSRNISDEPVRVPTLGHADLFGLLVRTSRHEGIFAYELHGSAVRSAIAGRPSGSVFGDRGVRFVSGGFNVRRLDTTHVGSINYRDVLQYRLRGETFERTKSILVPDYARSAYPVPSAEFHPANGDRILLRLRIANTEAERDRGLMFVKSMDPDTGMVFVWSSPVSEAFWMENTYIPLSIAFITADGRIEDIQDMAPLTTDNHWAPAPYQYAIEANQGFFSRYGITVGDVVHFHLGT